MLTLPLSTLSLQLPSWLPRGTAPLATDRAAVFVAETLDDWLLPESSQHNGLLLKRPFAGKWDDCQPDIDDCAARFQGTTVVIKSSEVDQTHLALDALIAKATLPAPLSAQIREDAFALVRVWDSLCPSADAFEVKLEIFGERMCARWHQDHFVGRAIVSYTGAVGTEYTRDANVNFSELHNGGDNDVSWRPSVRADSHSMLQQCSHI